MAGVYYVPSEPYGVIEIRGRDAADYLQRMTSNDLSLLRHHSGIRSVLLTEKGRILDLLTIVRQEGGYWVVTSPGNAETVYRWLRKYVVMDDVQMHLMAEQLQSIELWWNGHDEQYRSIPFDLPRDEGECNKVTIDNSSMHIVCLWHATGGENTNLHMLLLLHADQGAVFSWLESNGFSPINLEQRELLRITAGIGQYPNEFNEAYTPYEAGLARFVKLGKGCFIGQEVLERQFVQQKRRWVLYGFTGNDDGAFHAGMAIYDRPSQPDTREQIGVITSVASAQKKEPTSPSVYGLCYIRSHYPLDAPWYTSEGIRLYLAHKPQTIE